MTRSFKIGLAGIGLGAAALMALGSYLLSRPIHGEWDRQRRAESLALLLSDELEQFRAEQGFYPSTDQGLAPLVERGYLRKIPIDPWGNPYHYVSPGVHNPKTYDLWSTGADGREAGEDMNRDVTNWGPSGATPR